MISGSTDQNSGRAILGLATEDSEVAAILRETDCGLTADPGDIGAIVKAVRALKDGPERRMCFAANARRYVAENFAMNKILKEHEDLMESMI